jgi:hypothetical protein
VYGEPFTRDSTFRRLRIGPHVRVGLTAEWADPEWDRRPASVDNLIELSRFESGLAGVYLDEGTTRTTVRRSSFANQSWAAIGDSLANVLAALQLVQVAELRWKQAEMQLAVPHFH